MTTLEQFVRRFGKQITHNGRRVFITDGDPTYALAFKELGWSDPHDDDAPASAAPAPIEVAVEPRAPEQAVLQHPTER